MSTTAVKVVAPLPPEVTALANTCQALAQEHALERFELAVKTRLERGINDDNDLRLADEMLSAVARAGDAVEAAARPVISAAHAVHKALLAEAGKWKNRWLAMDGALRKAILKYKADKEALARRQQAELERAAEEERKRREAEARKALRDGNVTAAQELLQQAQAVVAPVIMNATPVLDNSDDRKVWEIEVVDPMAVVQAIVAGTIPLSFIKDWDITLAKKEAGKRKRLDWPGVKAEEKAALRVKR